MTFIDIAKLASDDIGFRMALRCAPEEVATRLNLDLVATRALVSRKPLEVRMHMNSLINAETTVVTHTVTAVAVAVAVLVAA